MTQEEKSLLLQDLCARVPYGVKIEGYKLPYIILNSDWLHFMYTHQEFALRRPYLRPMSSMTKEEKAELNAITNEFVDNCFEATTPEERWKCTFLNSSNQIDWLNARHFDFRNLIERGLAIDCTGLNVY